MKLKMLKSFPWNRDAYKAGEIRDVEPESTAKLFIRGRLADAVEETKPVKVDPPKVTPPKQIPDSKEPPAKVPPAKKPEDDESEDKKKAMKPGPAAPYKTKVMTPAK